MSSVRNLLAAPPVGPLVLSGPEGAGTSRRPMLFERAGTDMLLRADLRERAVSGQSWDVVRTRRPASGYYFKSRDLADTASFRARSTKLTTMKSKGA